jgi:hypothetical protein
VVDPSDWRLQGQEQWLRGVELCRRAYRLYAKNPAWDHDHCEFCSAKFMVDDLPDVLHEGYCTLDERHWICAACFDDFNEMLAWIVVPTPTSEA